MALRHFGSISGREVFPFFSTLVCLVVTMMFSRRECQKNPKKLTFSRQIMNFSEKSQGLQKMEYFFNERLKFET